MILILLCSGDVETNPGPRNTRSQAFIDLEDLPDYPTQHTDILFRLLKEVHAQQMESAKNHAELIADIKVIKTGQKSIETKVGAIQKRLDAVEEKMKTFDHMNEDIVHLQSSVETLTSQQDTLQSRVDDLEDRSRRNNIILRGIPDNRETWEETEVHVREVLRDVLDPLPETAIERAHRLGQYHPGKCRPIIVRFSNFKTKNKLLSVRKKLMEKDVSVSEDFSPTTRHARKKLYEFAKTHTDDFQIRYNKLVMNKKHYIYNSVTDTVSATATPVAPVKHQGSAAHSSSA